MLISASLEAWEKDRELYKVVARTCAAVVAGCLVLGALRPAPLVLGLVLVVLLSIPWGFAVARRVAIGAEAPSE